jgi:hypothetical protein
MTGEKNRPTAVDIEGFTLIHSRNFCVYSSEKPFWRKQ